MAKYNKQLSQKSLNEIAPITNTNILNAMNKHSVWSNLNEKQKKFIVYYVNNNCENATLSYKQAGYVNKFMSSGAQKMTANKKIQAALSLYIAEYEKQIAQTTRLDIIKLDRIRAFYNPSDIVDNQGRLIVKDLKELGDLAYCIDSIEKKYYGKNNDAHTITVKLANRSEHLKRLSLVTGLTENSIQIEHTGNIQHTGVLVAPNKVNKEQWLSKYGSTEVEDVEVVSDN